MAKFEVEHTVSFDLVKEHFRDNWPFYAVGGGGVLVGVGIGIAIKSRPIQITNTITLPEKG